MNGINVTIYKEDDRHERVINKVLKIYFDNFDKKLQVPQNIVLDRIKKKKYDLNLVKKNDDIIGFSFVVRFKKLIFLDYIAIDINHHGKGYGKILFNYIYNYYVKKEKIADTLVLECENKLINMYKKWGCVKIPVKYTLSEEYHLNLMAKSELPLDPTKYYKIKSELLNFNKQYFKKIKNQNIKDMLPPSQAFTTKCMKNISIIINSILRDIYGNSGIYYNFLKGKPK